MTTIAPFNLAPLEAKVPAETRARLQQSAKEYEGIFLSQMMAIMFKDVDMNPMSDQSSDAAEEQYKGMLTNEYGKALSTRGPGIGLAQPLYKSLLEAQIQSQELKQ